MTLSRRSTIKTIGVVGAGSALSNSVLAVNEHEDDERDEDAQPAEDEETGAIRVAHFSPDAPEVDVYVNDQQILTGVAYNDVSPYLEIIPGTYTLRVTEAGSEEATVYEQQITVGSGYYTAAAIGELEPEADAAAQSDDESGLGADSDDESGLGAGNETDGGLETGNETDTALEAGNETDGGLEAGNETDGEDAAIGAQDEAAADAGTFDVLLLVDRPEAEVDDAIKGEEAGQVRLVHASPDAPAVDVAVESGQVLFEDVGYTEPSGYVGVSAGEVTLELYDAAAVDGAVVGDDETDESALGNESDAELEGGDNNETAADNGTAGNETATDGIGVDEPIAPEDDSDGPEPVAAVDLEVDQGQGYTIYAIGYLEEAEDAGLDDSTDDESDALADEGGDNLTDGNETDDNATAGNESDLGAVSTDDNESDDDAGLGDENETGGLDDSSEGESEDDRAFDTVVLPDGTMDANEADDVDDDNAENEEIDEEPMEADDEGDAGENETDAGLGNETESDSTAGNESAVGNETDTDAENDY